MQKLQTNKETIATNKQTHPYRIPVGLLVLRPVAAVAESLVAVVVRCKLAQERLLSSVRPDHCGYEDDCDECQASFRQLKMLMMKRMQCLTDCGFSGSRVAQMNGYSHLPANHS